MVVEITIMGLLVVLVAALVVFADRRLKALAGGPRREPDEKRPDMIRSGLPYVPPRG
jgi:hypothetical protein